MSEDVVESSTPAAPASAAFDPVSRFPTAGGKAPRDVQALGIRGAYEAFESGKRFVVLAGPPGCGKSYLAMTVAKCFPGGRYLGEEIISADPLKTRKVYSKAAWFLTVTKNLQDQYLTDEGLALMKLKGLKGKSAFPCNRPGVRDCSEGSLLYRGEKRCPVCPYSQAKEEAFKSEFTVANYHSWHANAREDWERELMVLDEAHELEPKILKELGTLNLKLADVPSDVLAYFDTLKARGGGPGVAAEDVAALPTSAAWAAAWPKQPTSLEAVVPVLRPLAVVCETISQRALDDAGGADGDDAKQAWLKYPKSTLPWCRKVLDAIEAQRDVLRAKDRIVVAPEKDMKGVLVERSFTMTPVHGRALAPRFFKGAARVLLMSATIGDFGVFCRSLNIPRSEAAYVELPCTFPAENRTINVRSMALRKGPGDWDKNFPRVLNGVMSIMRHHAGDKGLILLPANKDVERVIAGVGADCQQRLLRAYGKTSNAAVAQHKKSRHPTVLIASGLWAGLDLPDDMARFVILPVLPRPQLSDAVRARMADDALWYDDETLKVFIQGSMRGMRSERDRCFMYCFDEELLRILREGKVHIPKWFKDAIRVAR